MNYSTCFECAKQYEDKETSFNQEGFCSDDCLTLADTRTKFTKFWTNKVESIDGTIHNINGD